MPTNSTKTELASQTLDFKSLNAGAIFYITAARNVALIKTQDGGWTSLVNGYHDPKPTTTACFIAPVGSVISLTVGALDDT